MPLLRSLYNSIYIFYNYFASLMLIKLKYHVPNTQKQTITH